jgi:hypothetical protein
MTSKSISAILAFAAVLACVSSASAQHSKHRARPVCSDPPVQFSFYDLLFGTGPAPQANGCAPAVYSGGRFVGQDPDPNVRLQLRRDADNEGYHLNIK